MFLVVYFKIIPLQSILFFCYRKKKSWENRWLMSQFFFLRWPILLVSAYVKSCLSTSVAASLIPQGQKKILPFFKAKLMCLAFYFMITLKVAIKSRRKRFVCVCVCLSRTVKWDQIMRVDVQQNDKVRPYEML